MRINLLLNPANQSWIIQKITDQLASHLQALGVQVVVSDTVDASCDVVHHMSWAFANLRTAQPSTMLITHLDDPYKFKEVLNTLSTNVRVGICMSSDTMQQVIDAGAKPSSTYFIRPAHDGAVKPRRIAIGITSRVYPDGRKREAMLQQLAQSMHLDDFEFRIFGNGWDETNRHLTQAGAEVTYFGETDDFRKDYATLLSEIPKFDYYLYLGMDEGSLGTLDALCAGIPTITTPQGFHLDIAHGITHSVLTQDDLQAVFTSISRERNLRIHSVADLTWATFAKKHLEVWETLLSKQPLPSLPVCQQSLSALRAAQMQSHRRKAIWKNALEPRRALSALSRTPVLRPLRRWIDRLRLDKS
jgi:hypothetical protein